MAFGLTPARGDWEYRRLDQASTATFFKGDALTLNGIRQVVRYASTSSVLIGIAMQDSANSLPRGKALVAIPAPGCTAMADVDTGVAASELSFGQTMHIYKSGATNTSFVSFGALASVFSRVVQIVGPLDSAQSRIEVSFSQQGGIYNSASTTTFLS